jgi:hypothetical protein
LCTANLPTPTVAKGNLHFDVLTWTGTGGSSGATRSLTGLAFQPDFVWEKARSSGSGHQLLDAVRGVGQNKVLASNSAGTEPTPANTESLYGWLSSLDSGGFTVTNGTSTFDNWNKTSDTYVAWNWNAGGSNATNTAGTVTSTVRANTTAGFSIVTWTGTGTSSASVGHGLSSIPEFVLIKKRNKSENWYVAAQPLQNNYNYAYHMFLNTTGAQSGGNDPYYLGTQSSTSTVLDLAVGTANNGGNENGINYVAYCWEEVAGYSKFGSFVGNNDGSQNGPFVYLGFRPRFLLIKSLGSSDWFLLDSVRPTFNVIGGGNGGQLAANQTYTESTLSTYAIADFLSNGFKVRHNMTYGYWNASGVTYIYAAFAESPFKYSLAR